MIILNLKNICSNKYKKTIIIKIKIKKKGKNLPSNLEIEEIDYKLLKKKINND